MNENINLCKILEGCPEGFELWSSIYGKVNFSRIAYDHIFVHYGNVWTLTFCEKGFKWQEYPDAECVLFPSRDQRDWSKFLPFAKRLYIRGDSKRRQEVRALLDKYADGKLTDPYGCRYDDPDLLYTITGSGCEDSYQTVAYNSGDGESLKKIGYREIFLPEEEPGKECDPDDIISYYNYKSKVVKDAGSRLCSECYFYDDITDGCVLPEDSPRTCAQRGTHFEEVGSPKLQLGDIVISELDNKTPLVVNKGYCNLCYYWKNGCSEFKTCPMTEEDRICYRPLTPCTHVLGQRGDGKWWQQDVYLSYDYKKRVFRCADSHYKKIKLYK